MPSQAEIQRQITDRILDGLKSGTIPWRKPWRADENSGSPADVISRRPYSGVNPILLDLVAMSRGYMSCHWGTYDHWAIAHYPIGSGVTGVKCRSLRIERLEFLPWIPVVTR